MSHRRLRKDKEMPEIFNTDEDKELKFFYDLNMSFEILLFFQI